MSAGLDLARWIINEHRPDGSCPRAAAILLRQRLEATMARHRMAPAEVDDGLAGEVRHVWVQLTRASRGHFPAGSASREQLAAWAEVIARIEELPAGAPTFR
jgi:hypothetical protein